MQRTAGMQQRHASDVERVAPTVVDAMIRTWRLARLSSDSGALGLARDTIVKLAADPSGTRPGRTGTEAAADKLTDAERVQAIVDRMPEQYRDTFEAYHLGIIRGESCRALPHAARAPTLGISRKTYYRRERWGWGFVRDWLRVAFDW